MFTAPLNKVIEVIEHYTHGIWGAKAVTPDGDWSIENIARWIVYYSNQYKIDILLPLAQGVLECHFGVNPAAKRSRKTRNIYNVGNVDSGANEAQASWQKGIERYCRLLHQEYNWGEDPEGFITLECLVKHDFMRPKGGRYATAPDYTKQVAQLAKKIKPMLGLV